MSIVGFIQIFDKAAEKSARDSVPRHVEVPKVICRIIDLHAYIRPPITSLFQPPQYADVPLTSVSSTMLGTLLGTATGFGAALGWADAAGVMIEQDSQGPYKLDSALDLVAKMVRKSLFGE